MCHIHSRSYNLHNGPCLNTCLVKDYPEGLNFLGRTMQQIHWPVLSWLRSCFVRTTSQSSYSTLLVLHPWRCLLTALQAINIISIAWTYVIIARTEDAVWHQVQIVSSKCITQCVLGLGLVAQIKFSEMVGFCKNPGTGDQEPTQGNPHAWQELKKTFGCPAVPYNRAKNWYNCLLCAPYSPLQRFAIYLFVLICCHRGRGSWKNSMARTLLKKPLSRVALIFACVSALAYSLPSLSNESNEIIVAEPHCSLMVRDAFRAFIHQCTDYVPQVMQMA